ncbi:hypothetical protein P2Q59_18655 [Escherichia coli]
MGKSILEKTLTRWPVFVDHFNANGEGWLIGWRSLWYTWGQKETGEWQWTFQVGDLENVNITHWAVMPKAPEAGA